MNGRSNLRLLAALAALALTSCQSWGPTWSEVSGGKYSMTLLDRFPTSINAIDGSNPGPASVYRPPYYKLTPGQHTVEVQALNPTRGWVGGINLRDATITFEPCKRYYLNAQFVNPLLTDWTPVVDYVEPIAGCQTVAMAK